MNTPRHFAHAMTVIAPPISPPYHVRPDPLKRPDALNSPLSIAQ